MLKKNEVKNPSKVKSYKHVIVLPVIRNIGEIMTLKRIKERMSRDDKLDKGQFRFTEGVGMIDALLILQRQVQ